MLVRYEAFNLHRQHCVCVFKAPRTLDPVLRALVSPRGTRERLTTAVLVHSLPGKPWLVSA